jgi:type IV pilus assembly protein PilF
MNKLNVAFLVLITCSLVHCATKNRDKKKEAQNYLSIGTSYLQQGRYPQALTALLNASRLDEESPVIFNHLGLAYFVREKYDLAQKNILKAIQLSPSYTDAMNNLGRVYIEKKDYKKAILILTKAVNDLEYPHPEKSYSNLGLAYLRNKKYKESLPFFKKSLEIRRENCHTYHYYARSLYEIASYHKANQAFKSAILFCHKQNFPDPIYYSALSHLKVGHKEQAIAKLKEVKEYYSDSRFFTDANKLLEILHKGNR